MDGGLIGILVEVLRGRRRISEEVLTEKKEEGGKFRKMITMLNEHKRKEKITLTYKKQRNKLKETNAKLEKGEHRGKSSEDRLLIQKTKQKSGEKEVRDDGVTMQKS